MSGNGDKCWLHEEPFKMCCCNSIYHRPVYSHPWHPTELKWVCAAPEDDGLPHISSSAEHACGCELYTPPTQQPEQEKQP